MLVGAVARYIRHRKLRDEFASTPPNCPSIKSSPEINVRDDT